MSSEGEGIFDLFRATDEMWSPLCATEAWLAVAICYSNAPSAEKAGQILASYFYLVSRRNSKTISARVSDAEVASATPKIRGKGFVSADTYRKRVKPYLVAWGLVSYDEPNNTERGKQCTEYYFPAFERQMIYG